MKIYTYIVYIHTYVNTHARAGELLRPRRRQLSGYYNALGSTTSFILLLLLLLLLLLYYCY